MTGQTTGDQENSAKIIGGQSTPNQLYTGW